MLMEHEFDTLWWWDWLFFKITKKSNLLLRYYNEKNKMKGSLTILFYYVVMYLRPAKYGENYWIKVTLKKNWPSYLGLRDSNAIKGRESTVSFFYVVPKPLHEDLSNILTLIYYYDYG
jgi:hypothetical protein